MTSSPTCVRSAAVVQVSNVVDSTRFYEDKLGFKSNGLWGEPPCFSIVGRGAVTLFLDQSRNGTIPKNQYWAAYIYVDDVDTLHAEFLDKNVDITRGIEEMPHGCREFDVRDPDGHLIAFGQDIRPGPQGPGL